MNILFSILLEIMAAAAFIVPAFLLLNRICFHNMRKSAVYCLFSLYLSAVYFLVGMPNVTYIRPDLNLNLIPFADMITDPRSTILNIILFVPLGFALPILWNRFGSRKNTLLFALGMSLTIELLQILTLRATDVNDLMTNVFGAFLGFSAAKLLICRDARIRAACIGQKPSEPYIVCALTFFMMFFAQPFLSTLLWRVIL